MRTCGCTFFRVLSWRGEPHPREEQALAWQRRGALSVAPLLPANGPVLRALALPAGPGHHPCLGDGGRSRALKRLDDALARGLRLVMVREKQMARAAREVFAAQVVSAAHAVGRHVLVNSDAQVAAGIGADGVHLPSQLDGGASAAAVRAGAALPATSDMNCARRASSISTTSVLGPVLPTASHGNRTGLGWAALRGSGRQLPLPVYALGGMRWHDLEERAQAGAHGIAMMRGAW